MIKTKIGRNHALAPTIIQLNKMLKSRYVIPFVIILFLLGPRFGTLANTYGNQYGAGHVLVCGDNLVLLVDNQNSINGIPKIVWTWNAHEAMDLPEEYRTKRFNSIDDCKAIKGGKQILVSSSSGAIAVINMDDKKVIFHAEVPNAHSIELLPRNLIAAAASTNPKGNSVMIFDISKPGKILFKDSLYSAHGVVWDKGRKTLFALGYDVLREYKIEKRYKLKKVNEWKIPGIGGHDLMMAPGGKKLFITEETGAWIFNIKSGNFSKINGFPDAENIKSINQNNSRQFVYTVPEVSWWTFHVSFLSPENKLGFPGMRVYKARWFNPDN